MASAGVAVAWAARAVVAAPEDRGPLRIRGVDGVDELVDHLERITGVVLPVITDAAEVPEGMLSACLGAQADTGLDELVHAEGDSISSFALRVTVIGVDVRGLGGEGTLFGIYELLEQLGVRWYMPGELGLVVPELDTVRLALQETVQVPSIKQRQLSGWLSRDTGWYVRQRMGGDVRPTGRHGMPGNPPRGTSRQVCLSGDHAPGALAAVVDSIRNSRAPTDDTFYVNMGPADGGGYCQCEGCRALDGDSYDPLRNAPSMTDRYIWFFNRVLEELENDYPNMHIVWYVYAAHFFPPEHKEPNPRIVGTFALIGLDRNRGMDNPMSPDRHVLRNIIDGWAQLNPNALNYRGYYNNLACPQFPWSQLDRVRNEIPSLYEKGLDVFRVEVIRQSWASSPITRYAASRVMWDKEPNLERPRLRRPQRDAGIPTFECWPRCL